MKKLTEAEAEAQREAAEAVNMKEYEHDREEKALSTTSLMVVAARSAQALLALPFWSISVMVDLAEATGSSTKDICAQDQSEHDVSSEQVATAVGLQGRRTT